MPFLYHATLDWQWNPGDDTRFETDLDDPYGTNLVVRVAEITTMH